MRHWFFVLGLAAAVALAPSGASAQVQEVRIDTVSVRQIGPGMTYMRLHAPAIPWVINVIEVDLKNPYLDVEAVKARDLRAGGLERTSDIAARRGTPTRRVVGAVNAGFFGAGGALTGLHVGDGEVAGSTGQPSYSSIGVSRDMGALVGALAVTTTAISRTGSRTVNLYNDVRGANALVLYNRYMGASTRTDASGTELQARAIGPWALNDTVRVVVTQKQVGAGNTELPAGHIVLSGAGTSAPFLQAIAVGDTVRVVQRTVPGIRRLDQVVSGFPLLIANGQRTSLPSIDHHNLRHPRTAMGINADTTRLYLVTVDGRIPSSAGQTSREQQDLMLRLGMAHAQGLDGGGSTTMVVDGAVANIPSDGPGTERAVGDAFVIVSTAPRGPLARLDVSPSQGRFFRRETLQLTVRGTDAFFASLPLDASRLRYEIDPALGTVSSTGLFTAGLRRGTGYARVRYDGGLVDSARVSITGIARVEVTPAVVATDTARAVTFRVRTTDDDGTARVLPVGDVRWRVLDPSVGSVTPGGVFRGIAAGTTFVVAETDGVSDTSAVRVEIGTGASVLDPFDAIGAWRVGGIGIDTAATRLRVLADPAATGGRSVALDYRFTENSGAVPIVRLATDMPIYGVPDSLTFRVRSDGANHRVFLEFEDGAGTPFTTSIPRYVNDSTAYALMPAPMLRSNVSYASIVFPVRLTGMRFELAYTGGRVSGKTYSSTLLIDDLRLTYPARATAADAPASALAGLVFTGLVPNPARDRATVSFRSDRAAPVRIVLYDLLGRARMTVYDGAVAPGAQSFVVDTSGLPSGVYFLQGSTPFAAPLSLVVAR